MKTTKVADLRSVFGNVIWLLSERAIQVALALIVGGLIARNFGPDLYGKWQYAISLLFMATTLTYLCGSEVIVPKLVQRVDAAGRILGTAFLIRSVASVAGFLFGQLAVYLWIKDAEVAAFIRWLLLLLLFSEPFAVVVAWFQSRTHIAPVVKIRLGALAFKALVVVTAFYLSFPAWLIALAWVGEGFCVMLLLMIIYRQGAAHKWEFSRADARSYVKEGFTYWIGLLLMSAFLRLDRFFLAEYVGFEMLGVYSAAIQISENWFMLAAILSQSIAPRFIYAKLSMREIDRNIKYLLVLYVTLAVLGSLLIALLSPVIISVIFGSAYSGSANILRYTAFVSVGVFVDSLFNVLMLKNGASFWVGIKWLLVLVSALLINYYFVSDFGLYAPIVALYVGYGVACMIGCLYWLRWRKGVFVEAMS